MTTIGFTPAQLARFTRLNRESLAKEAAIAALVFQGWEQADAENIVEVIANGEIPHLRFDVEAK